MRKLLILAMVVSTPTWADTIYQCRDARGQVTLQDAPCSAATDRVVRSGQDVSRERYLKAGGDANQSYARGLMYGVTCRIANDSYRAARAAADVAASSGNVAQMQEANARVARAGQSIAEQGC